MPIYYKTLSLWLPGCAVKLLKHMGLISDQLYSQYLSSNLVSNAVFELLTCDGLLGTIWKVERVACALEAQLIDAWSLLIRDTAIGNKPHKGWILFPGQSLHDTEKELRKLFLRTLLIRDLCPIPFSPSKYLYLNHSVRCLTLIFPSCESTLIKRGKNQQQH